MNQPQRVSIGLKTDNRVLTTAADDESAKSEYCDKLLRVQLPMDLSR